MNNGNKIWIEPGKGVNLLADVSSVLGHASNNVRVLCTSTKINKWSKNKPTKGGGKSALTSSDRVGLNWSMLPTLLDNPELFGYMLRDEGTLWKYDRPVTNFRMLDFNGYIHNSWDPSIIKINAGPFGASNNKIRIQTGSPGDLEELITYKPLSGLRQITNEFSRLNWGFLIGGFNYENVFYPAAYYPVTGREDDSLNANRVDLYNVSVAGGADGPYAMDYGLFGQGETSFMAVFTTWDPVRAKVYSLAETKPDWSGAAWVAMDTIVKAEIKEPVTPYIKIIPEQFGRWDGGSTWTIGLRIRIKSNVTFSTPITVSGTYKLTDQNYVDYPFENGNTSFSATLQAGSKSDLGDYQEVIIDKVWEQNNALWVYPEVGRSNEPSDTRLDKHRYNWLTDSQE